MIQAAKDFAKRHWPLLRLRTILLTVLLFSAAMPGVGAVFLRVYENTLVRQTEAELVAQGAALAATAEALWPGANLNAAIPPTDDPNYLVIRTDRIDLSSDAVLPERPTPRSRDVSRIDAQALAVERQFDPIVRQTERFTLASVILLDRNGRAVTPPVEGADYSTLPEVADSMKGAPATVLRRNGDYRPTYSFEWLSRASALRVHHARPIVVNGQVVGTLLLSRSARALFRGLYEDRGKIAFGVAVIFGVLFVLAGFVSRGVTLPIEGLSKATRDVAAGRGMIPEPPQTAAIEIRQLYEDFRAMAEAISIRSRYLKDFAAALSHEFKTPLAGIAGAVEILEDHYGDMSEADRRRFLSNISDDTGRLSKLVSRLLDLARADMAAPDADAAADIRGVVQRLAEEMSTPDFEVSATLPGLLPSAAMPAAALTAVLTSLVENSRQAGARRVHVEAIADDGAIALTVTDDGPGVPAADLGRIFEPFFTSRRAEGGSGLGLPIARSLLSASGGEIDAAKAACGARFVLRLPVARPL